MALVDKMRKARESTVEAGEFIWTIRRPTDLEMIRLRRSGSEESIFPFVIGWAKKSGGLPSEMDLGLPGGDPHPLEFDPDAAADYLADHATEFAIVMRAVADAHLARQEELGEAAKN